MAATDPTQVACCYKDALVLGLPFYMPKRPCVHGHHAAKRVSNFACTQCELNKDRRRREKRKLERAQMAPAPQNPERVVSRKDAREKGLLRYWSGLPCKRGHVAERLVSDKTCVECDRLRKVGSESVKQRCRAYYRANRAKLIQQSKEHVEKNRERVSAQRKAFRQANKDRINAKIAEWAKNNPEKRRAKERGRESRERGATGSHTYADIQDIVRLQRGRCANPSCRKKLAPGTWHEDHILPISKGGTDDRRNIQLLCQPCNLSKHARHPIEWAQMNGCLL